MDSKEYNKLAARLMKEGLGPLGFKKSRINVCIYNSPKIMTVYKHTFRGTFLGYYLGITYDFMSNVKVENGTATPPAYLEDYPTSISLFRLFDQYEKHDKILDFECGLHFHSWDEGLSKGNAVGEMMTQRRFDSAVTSSFEAAEQYIQETISDVKTIGMKFFEEMTPEISLNFLDRHFEGEWSYVKSLQEDLKNYLNDE